MKHLYRKAFVQEFEAQETAKGFFKMPGIAIAREIELLGN